MAFFVYGTDPRTGKAVSRFLADAATEAQAREQAARQGVRVTAIAPSHSTSAIVLPELPRAQPGEADVINEEVASFDRTLEKMTPRVVVTYWLVGANALVFALMTLSGVNVLDPGFADLVRWGADYGPRTTDGESWRLLSSLFVHIGILHLLFNMIAFLYVAPTAERMFGHVGFLLTYAFAGLAGSWWAFFYNPTQLHAGASGAIFGIYGALLAQLLRDRQTIPAHELLQLRNFVLVFIAYNLINSLRPGISLAAHVGGMVGGFVCGLLLARTFAPEARAGRLLRHAAVAVAGVVLFVWGAAIANARYPNLGPLLALLDRAEAAMGKFNVAQHKRWDKKISDADFAALIEHDVLPEWKPAHAALTQLKPVPPSLQSNVEAIVDYMALREQHWEALLNALHEVKGRAWLHTDHHVPSKEEIRQFAQRQSDYFDATWDLDHATVDASARGEKIKRMRQLAARVKSLDERDHANHMHIDFDKYSELLERDELPELRSIQESLAQLAPLPRDLEQDAAGLLDHLHSKQDEWEPRVAYRHYERWEKEADEKRSRANRAARAIEEMPGVRLFAPS